jgi:hypothetical protein
MVWVLVAVVVVLLLAIGVFLARQQRSRQLREGLGPEYDRVVAKQGDQRAAEKELLERRRRYDRFVIRPLEASARAEYRQRWDTLQRRFVDQPDAAVGQAGVLVRQVMRDRGYPVDVDFEQVADDVSVEHPVVVENYRAAHAISARATNGRASTEDLRQALVHFRALFAELLGHGESTGQEAPERDEMSHGTATRG